MAPCIAPQAFALRFEGGGEGDRLLIVNLGCDIDLTPAARAAAGAAGDCRWIVQLEQRSAQIRRRWHPAGSTAFPRALPGESAILLRSEPGDSMKTEEKKTMPDVTRTIPVPGSHRRRRSAAAARMAGHQRARRLCLGDRRRRGDPPVSGPADRVAARAARPARDAESPAGARRACRTITWSWLGDEGAVAAPNTADRCAPASSSGSTSGCRCGAIELPRRHVIEKRLLMPYGQNTVHVTYRLLDVHRAGSPSASRARRFISAATSAPVDTSLRRVLHADLLRRPLRGERRKEHPAAAAARRTAIAPR